MPAESAAQKPVPYGRMVVVKFKEGTKVRMRRARLTSAVADEVAGVEDVLKQFPGAEVSRLFSRPEKDLEADRKAIAEVTEEPPSDLNLFYRVDVTEGQDPEALAEALRNLPNVEMAYIEPEYQVAAEVPTELLEGMVMVATCPPGPTAPTPDFSSLQHYLNPAPTGIDAKYAWTKTGGKGLNVKFTDIEFGWNLNHEDLTSAAGATVFGTNTGDDHGTNVLGEIIGRHNGFGVAGIAPDAQVGVLCSAKYQPIADCINHAASVLSAGDVILIELQTSFRPVEIYEANYVAIQAAVAAGVVVVEAAGNGSYNLDDYNRPASMGGGGYILRRSVRDSGAIMAGAGCPPTGTYGPDRSRWQYSNYGSRLDVQGQARDVCTTGDGALFDAGPNRRYNNDFRNTSAASPQVVGAVLALQGVAKAKGGPVLTPAQARQLLVNTGSPQQDGNYGPATQQIGPRPNLKAAIEQQWPTPCPPAPMIACPPAPHVLCPPAPRILCPPAPRIACPPAPFVRCPPAPQVLCPPAPRIVCPPAPFVRCPPAPQIMCPPAPQIACPPAPQIACPPAPQIMCPPAPQITCPPGPSGPIPEPWRPSEYEAPVYWGAPYYTPTLCPPGPIMCPPAPQPPCPPAPQPLCPPAPFCPPAPRFCPPAPRFCPPAPRFCPPAPYCIPAPVPPCPPAPIPCPPAPQPPCPPAPQPPCPPAPITCPPNPIACPPAPITCPPNPIACPPAPITCPPNPIACPPAPITCPPNPTACPPAPVACPPAPLSGCPPAPSIIPIPEVGYGYAGYTAGYGYEYPGYEAGYAYGYQPSYEAYGYPGYEAGYAYGYQPSYEAYGYPGYEAGYAYGYQPGYEAYGYPAYEAGYGYGYQPGYWDYGYGYGYGNPGGGESPGGATSSNAPEGDFDPQMGRQ